VPSNFLLLLPILGGYLFNTTSHFFHFRAQALRGHRLVFEAAVVGILFLIPARILILILVAIGWPEWLLARWPQFTNDTALVGTSSLAVILAPLAAILWNLGAGFRHRERIGTEKLAGFSGLSRPLRRWWKASRDYYLDRAIRRSGDGLQQILHDVAVRSSTDGTVVGITLKSGKIYAAYVTRSPNLSPDDEYVMLAPLMSGYRDAGTQEVRYRYLYPGFEDGVAGATMTMVVPTSEIQIAHVLDRASWNTVLERLKTEEPGDESA